MSGPNATVWSPPQQNEGEYTLGAVNTIADSTNNQLVDASGVSIIDGGETFTSIAGTTWSENDTA